MNAPSIDLEALARGQAADIVELEKALEAARADARRLAAALRLTMEVASEGSCLAYLIVGPHHCELTLGHIVDGALALHNVELAKGRLPL